jgi:hypothetical protein
MSYQNNGGNLFGNINSSEFPPTSNINSSFTISNLISSEELTGDFTDEDFVNIPFFSGPYNISDSNTNTGVQYTFTGNYGTFVGIVTDDYSYESLASLTNNISRNINIDGQYTPGISSIFNGESNTLLANLNIFINQSRNRLQTYNPWSPWINRGIWNFETKAPPKPLTFNINIDSKTYDGTTGASANITNISGIVGSDEVILTAIAFFTDKNAGDEKNINVTIVGSGDDIDKYSFDTSRNILSSITAKDVSGTFDAYDKEYDGTVEAEVSGAVVVNGKVEGDDVQIIITKAEFVDPNIEENKVVWAKEYGLTGTSASNYHLVTIYPTLASITPRLLSASIQLNSTPKVYDGSSSLNLNQVNISDVSGIVSTDDVQVTVLGASFEDANAGTGKSLNVQLGLTGADATKYTIDSSANITGTITPKLLDVTIVNSGSKPYDANIDATSVVSEVLADPSQIISGDTVYVDVSSATFNDKNAESNKPLNIVLKLTGSDADNYDVSGGKSVNGQTASITSKELTVTITSAPSKTFDGNQTVTDISAILFRVDGPVNGETPNVKINSATYDRIIGGNLSATFSVLDTNYSLSSPTVFALQGITAIIYPKNIDISFSVLPKIYDGNNNVDLSDVTIEYIGVIEGFPVSKNLIGAYYQQSFPGNWNVILDYTMETDSYYIIANQLTGNFQGQILPKPIDVQISVSNKVYDGTIDASANGDISDNSQIISGEQVNLRIISANFNNASVGDNKNVTVYYFLDGMNGLNYTTNQVSPIIRTANITPKPLILNISANDKVYDGTTGASAIVDISSGLVGSDIVDVQVDSAYFEHPSVGNNKNVNIYFSLNGMDAGNYTTEPLSPAIRTANITPGLEIIDISGTFDVYDKEYDGTVEAEVSGAVIVNGKVQGDDVQILITKAEFLDPNAEEDKVVWAKEYGLTGTSASKYNLVTVYPTLASISPKDISGEVLVNSKDYDGTKTAIAQVTNLIGIIQRDIENVSVSKVSANFNDPEIGIDKDVTIHFEIKGSKSMNYKTLNVSGKADIYSSYLKLIVEIQNKVYDGTKTAFFSKVTPKLIMGDDSLRDLPSNITLSYQIQAFFQTEEVGTNIPTKITEANIIGANASKFIVIQSESTSANITRKPVQAIVIFEKEYDGTTAGGFSMLKSKNINTIEPIDIDKVDLTLQPPFTFDISSIDVGTYLTNPIQRNQAYLSGSRINNYILSSFNSQFQIIPKKLSVTLPVQSKIYDVSTIGYLEPDKVPTFQLVNPSDQITFDFDRIEFLDYYVGQDKPVNAIAPRITGSSSINYELVVPVTSKANIYKKDISGSFDAFDKIYDGTTGVSYDISSVKILGVYPQDSNDVQLKFKKAYFETSDVGENNVIADPSGIDFSGNLAYNYNLKSFQTKANIYPININYEIQVNDKYYDKTRNATLKSLSYSGILASDISNVIVDVSDLLFNNIAIANNKSTTNKIILSGDKKNNYSFSLTNKPKANILKPLTFTSPKESYEEDFYGNDYYKKFGLTGQSNFVYSIEGQLPDGISFENGDLSGSLLSLGIFDFVVNASIPSIYTESKPYTIRVKELVSIRDGKIFPLSTLNLESGSKFLFKDPHLTTFYQNVKLFFATEENKPLILGDSINDLGTQIYISEPKDYYYIYGQVENPKSFYSNVEDLVILKVFDKNGNLVQNVDLQLEVYGDFLPKPVIKFYLPTNPSLLSGIGKFSQRIGLKIKYDVQLIRGDGALKIYLEDQNEDELSPLMQKILNYFENIDENLLKDFLLTHQIDQENVGMDILVNELKIFIQNKFPNRPSQIRIQNL